MMTLLVCAMIVVAALLFGWARHYPLAELRRQNAELRAGAAEILRYKTERAQLDRMVIDTNELRRLRAERSELMSLRSEIGRLRQTAKSEVPQLQQQVESTAAHTSEARQREANLLAERSARQISRLTASSLGSLVDCVRNVARVNRGKIPGSFAELEVMASADPRKRMQEHVSHILAWTNHLSPRETELTGVSFSASARSFEFMRFDRPLNTKNPPVPFIREITPRRLPDGSCARDYGFTDGRVEELVSRDGDFSGWEAAQK